MRVWQGIARCYPMVCVGEVSSLVSKGMALSPWVSEGRNTLLFLSRCLIGPLNYASLAPSLQELTCPYIAMEVEYKLVW